MADLSKFARRAVAKRLGVSVKTVDRLAEQGRLRKVRLSKRTVIIDPETLRDLLGDKLYAELFADSPALPRAGDKEQRGKEVDTEMLEQIVHHLVIEPLEVGTPGNIRWTSEPHPLCTKVREELEWILDYIPDDSCDSGYRDGELDEEITDPYILELIRKVESLPCIYETESGVSLHRDDGIYYLGYHVDSNRHLWYRVHERYSDELDALITDLYAALYNRVENDMAKEAYREKMQRAGLWQLVSERLER